MSEPQDPSAKTVPEDAPPVRADEPSLTHHDEETPSSNPATIAYAERPPSSIAFEAGKLFGDYELQAELGRGGMGVVYKALHKDLKRTVALKMVLAGRLSSAKEVQRFRTEAEAAARLNHNNIVQVYEVGCIEGCNYFTMEYINGPSLSQRLSDGPLSSRAAARYVLTIARAVEHAHRQGILHRDLKPGNILLDAEDQPHVADFGLAKKLDDSGQTRTGAVMGTPSYMPPEQAAGRVNELGPTADVYSLGAVLYELLTGRPPFRSETAMDTLFHVLERDAAPPRLLNPKVDRDLETICLKCLEKHPEERYPTAEALAQDLQRYIDGDSISARSFNVFDRLTRTLDRTQYIAEFHHWGNMMLLFALIVLVEHIFVFVLTLPGPPYPRAWIMTARFSQFGLMALIFWWHRSHTVMPTSAAERQLWSIWIGYLIACMLASVANSELNRFLEPREHLTMYPLWSILTGLAFFVMGSNYWGWCYALGMGFFAMALLMPLSLSWAALEFGLMWAFALAFIGLHLRRMGKTNAPVATAPFAASIHDHSKED